MTRAGIRLRLKRRGRLIVIRLLRGGRLCFRLGLLNELFSSLAVLVLRQEGLGRRRVGHGLGSHRLHLRTVCRLRPLLNGRLLHRLLRRRGLAQLRQLELAALLLLPLLALGALGLSTLFLLLLAPGLLGCEALFLALLFLDAARRLTDLFFFAFLLATLSGSRGPRRDDLVDRVLGAADGVV